jgi:hypothetical protein
MLLRRSEKLPPATAGSPRGGLLNRAAALTALVPDGAYAALPSPAIGPRRATTTRTA